MSSKVRSLRADDDLWNRWERVAVNRGLTLNRWAVRVLTAEADRLEAEERRALAQRFERDRLLQVKRGEFS